MDLINALVSQAGVSQSDAKGLAGGILGHVQSAIAGEDPSKAAEFKAAVPELDSWQQAAAPEKKEEGGLLGALGGALGGGGAGGLGGLMGSGAGASIAGAVGGADAKNAVVMMQVLGRFGVDSGKATLVAPLVLQFLKSRLKPATLATAMSAAPFLMQFVGKKGAAEGAPAPQKAEESGGLGGLLGGLLG